MELFFYIPTELIVGKDCVAKNAQKLALGKRALVVAGKSADTNGAMRDVDAALKSVGIPYARVMGAKPNPDLDDVRRIVDAGTSFAADFVIAIGGGSPIDAAKLAAALIKSGMSADDLLDKPLPDAALPIAAIPTTAGTGTEANSYSIITLYNPKRKLSFAVPSMAPRIGLLDARYTYSLDARQTSCTAIDALAHLIEGYVRQGYTPVGEMLALSGASRLARCKDALIKKEYDENTREELLYASMLGGVELAHAKTIAPHVMGYALTVFRDMPHGQACGVLMRSFLEHSLSGCKKQVSKLLGALEMKDLNELGDFIKTVLPPRGEYTPKELEDYADYSLPVVSTKPNPVKIGREEMLSIYSESLLD